MNTWRIHITDIEECREGQAASMKSYQFVIEVQRLDFVNTGLLICFSFRHRKTPSFLDEMFLVQRKSSLG